MNGFPPLAFSHAAQNESADSAVSSSRTICDTDVAPSGEGRNTRAAGSDVSCLSRSESEELSPVRIDTASVTGRSARRGRRKIRKRSEPWSDH